MPVRRLVLLETPARSPVSIPISVKNASSTTGNRRSSSLMLHLFVENAFPST